MAKVQGGITLNPKDYDRVMDLTEYMGKHFGVDVRTIIANQVESTVQRMKRDAPVDTGHLRTEITADSLGGDELEIRSIAIDEDTGVDYAPRQEFGIGVPKQPYFFKHLRRFAANVEYNIRAEFRRLTSGTLLTRGSDVEFSERANESKYLRWIHSKAISPSEAF